MKMMQAIAESAGNKARAINDNGHIVIVQQRYGEFESWWYHIWHIIRGTVEAETDIKVSGHMGQLISYYSIDPLADYWQAV